ncbi:MAG: lysine-sensitive aspartokinase 3 [Acidobacteria bacterium]|nr:MAG: lysine-sensitive aspartokinase 3 [Acidobacteriota bacterium]
MSELLGGSAGERQCVVMKFGGTSVEDAAAIRRLCQIVKGRLRHRQVAVVSALAAVTDQLFAAGRTAAEGKLETALAIVRDIQERHLRIAGELLGSDEGDLFFKDSVHDFRAAVALLRSISAARDFSLRAQDHLLSMGEHFSSKLVRAALVRNGLEAVWVDAKECIITDAAHTRATPLCDETNRRLQILLAPLLQADRIPVLGGFAGSTLDGIPTTLGRGGSDFSAAIVGAGLHAKKIEIWTDVDGVMTTDPDLCSEAQRVSRMSFEEAAELAYFGAKVLHPATLLPARRQNIPVWVLNSRNPGGAGTEICGHSRDEGRVKALSVKRGVAVVDVEPLRWLAPELLREVCEVFENHQHTLDLLSASRGSLSLLVTSIASLPAIAEELKGLASVRWENHKALVCLVGEKIRRRPEVASQVFRAIADIDVRMICQGASERSISFLVDESRAEESVQRLHKLFFSEARPGPPVARHALCQSGGTW